MTQTAEAIINEIRGNLARYSYMLSIVFPRQTAAFVNDDLLLMFDPARGGFTYTTTRGELRLEELESLELITAWMSVPVIFAQLLSTFDRVREHPAIVAKIDEIVKNLGGAAIEMSRSIANFNTPHPYEIN
jgi:hypothetical protein